MKPKPRRLDKLDATALAELRDAYFKGDLAALVIAVDICVMRFGLPDWIMSAVADVAKKQIQGTKRRGRVGNYSAQRKQHAIHHVRWATVLHLRENCPERKLTWDGAYAEASQELRGTAAQGSADRMKASYRKFLRDGDISRLPTRQAMRNTARWVHEIKDSLLQE